MNMYTHLFVAWGARRIRNRIISSQTKREANVFVGNMSAQTTTDAPLSDESLTREASHPRGMECMHWMSDQGMLIGLSSRDHRPTRVYVRVNWNAPRVCYSIATRARTTKPILITIKMDAEKQIHTRYSRHSALTHAITRRGCLYWTLSKLNKCSLINN